MPLDHYIPQVHLKNFYSPFLGDQMYAMRKRDLKSFTTKAKSVCVIRNGSTNAYLREDRTIEEFLKTIEPRYNKALEKLIGDSVDDECIYTIAGFVACVIACSPAVMRIQSQPLKSSVEAMAAMMEARGLIPPSPKELDCRSLVELLSAGVVDTHIDEKYPQALGIGSIQRSLAMLRSFRWEILLNDLKDNPFFTSDFPVAIEGSTNYRVINRLIPLAPNLAIRIRPDFSISKKSLTSLLRSFATAREVLAIKRLRILTA